MIALRQLDASIPETLDLFPSAHRGDRLQVVGPQAKTNPRAGVSLWMPCTGSNVFQHAVISLRVPPEELLDAGENGCDHPLASQHQRLQTPGHAPVAVAEGVDHRQVQM